MYEDWARQAEGLLERSHKDAVEGRTSPVEEVRRERLLRIRPSDSTFGPR